MAIAERNLRTMRRTLDRAQELMERGDYRDAIRLLETLFEAIDYWEGERDPELFAIMADARRLAGEIRGRMGGRGPWMGARRGEKEQKEEKDYAEMAKRDALEGAKYAFDRMVDDVMKKGQVSGDPRDYWEFEAGTVYYSSHDAVEVLEQLLEHQETDSGLWDGAEPLEAVRIMAAYTYGNAVYEEGRKLLGSIQYAVDELRDALNIPAGPKEWRPGKRGLTRAKVEAAVRGALGEEWR